MKTIKFICAIIALTVVTAACTKDDINYEFGQVAPNATAASANDFNGFHVTWNGVDHTTAIDINAVISDRTNSSSAGAFKISSHSQALPNGMVFHWSMHKNHDAHRGFLRVDANVFDRFESFMITTQQGNVYRDYVIVPSGEPVNGAYLFKLDEVFKQTNPTSVNNIWIGTFVEKEEENRLFTVTFVCLERGFLFDVVPGIREGVQKLYYEDVDRWPTEDKWNIPENHEIVPNIFQILDGKAWNNGDKYTFMEPVISDLTLTIVVKNADEGLRLQKASEPVFHHVFDVRR
jgi:hypothetical protein